MTPGRRLIGWAASVVPLHRRSQWRREWEAEVAYAWQRMTREGPPSRIAVLRLRVRILTCVIDALWEKKETMQMTGCLHDVRLAIRSLLRDPTFTAIAAATLALGIGVNTAVFTLVDGVLVSPLPHPRPDELIALRHLGRDGQDALPMSDGLYALYRERVTGLEEIAVHAALSVNLVWDGEPRRVPVRVVTPSFFQVLDVEAALGRTFSEEEGAPDGESAAILSDGLWTESFGADPSVIGSTLEINGVSRRVIGVMPPEFGYPDREARLWLPYIVDPDRAPLAAFSADGIARLSPGATLEGVDAELRGLISRLGELYPDSGAPAFLEEINLRPLVLPLKAELVGDVSATLWILLGTVALVLGIACANVANLLLVRTESRRRELALRIAVGAGRLQVLRSFLAESLVLAGVGSILGMLVAVGAVGATVDLVPTDLPRLDEVGLDLRVMGFTACVSLACALLFGFFPLLRYGVHDLAGELRDGAAHGATGGRERHRLRNGLVVAQLALALVLLVSSGLVFRSLQALRSIDPGFQTERVLTARISVPSGEVASWEAAAGFYRTLGERLSGQDAVEAVGFGQSVPFTGGVNFYVIEVEDHPRGPNDLPVFASNNQVEAGFLEALGVELLEGRTLTREDGAEGARSVVVSESFARRWWPDRSPIGRRVRIGFPDEDWYQIVGVASDAKYGSLEGEAEEVVYWPATIGPAGDPQPTRNMYVVMRTTVDPLGLVSMLRREVEALNPRIPVSSPRTMDDLLAAATSRTSFTMALLGAASGIALLLGLVGIYGVISYVVGQRTREIGIRLALGATAPSVRGMVVRQGLVLTGAGVLIGLVAAGVFSSIMSSLLYQVSATDPATYGAVAGALVVVSLLASWLPARRAAGVDPSRALRSE